MKKHYNHQDSFMKTRIFQPTWTLVVLFILTNTFLSAQVLDFDPTPEGPWSDVDEQSPYTLKHDQAMQFGRAVSE